MTIPEVAGPRQKLRGTLRAICLQGRIVAQIVQSGFVVFLLGQESRLLGRLLLCELCQTLSPVSLHATGPGLLHLLLERLLPFLHHDLLLAQRLAVHLSGDRVRKLVRFECVTRPKRKVLGASLDWLRHRVRDTLHVRLRLVVKRAKVSRLVRARLRHHLLARPARVLLALGLPALSPLVQKHDGVARHVLDPGRELALQRVHAVWDGHFDVRW
mmetsp:Transcript_92948/g.225695  ORF Transcript_92948/g.225695 Transcript_92948/m.225695 type:complete len:214 (+) Transcript_92948:260-901(+)